MEGSHPRAWRRAALAAVLVLAVALSRLALYANLATRFVDPEVFARKAWHLVVDGDGAMIGERAEIRDHGWDAAEVTMVRGAATMSTPLAAERTAWGLFSRATLFLNGGWAVHVVFHTELDGLLGPVGYYFNPFTGALIGADLRM